MSALAKAIEATRAAREVRDDVSRRRNEAVRKAEAEARDAFAHEMHIAGRRLAEAESAERIIRESIGSNNPLIGRKVTKAATLGSWRYGDNPKPEKHGVIAMMDGKTAWPRSYGVPRAGELYIRFLKKDGSESALVETMGRDNTLPPGWMFTDAERAKGGAA